MCERFDLRRYGKKAIGKQDTKTETLEVRLTASSILPSIEIQRSPAVFTHNVSFTGVGINS